MRSTPSSRPFASFNRSRRCDRLARFLVVYLPYPFTLRVSRPQASSITTRLYSFVIDVFFRSVNQYLAFTFLSRRCLSSSCALCGVLSPKFERELAAVSSDVTRAYAYEVERTIPDFSHRQSFSRTLLSRMSCNAVYWHVLDLVLLRLALSFSCSRPQVMIRNPILIENSLSLLDRLSRVPDLAILRNDVGPRSAFRLGRCGRREDVRLVDEVSD